MKKTPVTKKSVESLGAIPGLLGYIKASKLYDAISKFAIVARSTTEARFEPCGTALIEKMTGRKVIFRGYEWMSFKLPGGRYTPDWCFLLDTGQWVIVEVKASSYAAGYRDSRSKLRAAASLNPWHKFYEVRPIRGNEWTVEEIKPDESFVQNLMTAYLGATEESTDDT